MKVSRREEALARELYEIDSEELGTIGISWEEQISYVHNYYQRIAHRVVSSDWLKDQLAQGDVDAS